MSDVIASEEPLLTVASTALLLGVSRARAYELVHQGMPTVRIGKSLRIRPSSLRRWLESLESTGSTR